MSPLVFMESCLTINQGKHAISWEVIKQRAMSTRRSLVHLGLNCGIWRQAPDHIMAYVYNWHFVYDRQNRVNVMHSGGFSISNNASLSWHRAKLRVGGGGGGWNWFLQFPIGFKLGELLRNIGKLIKPSRFSSKFDICWSWTRAVVW